MAEFKADIECRSCKATGLYSGIAESKETAVVCYACKGTGRERFSFSYRPFNKRRKKPGIEHVYECNVGIKVGRGGEYQPSDFGGMPVSEWKSGKRFQRGMENRRCVCPAWWYQTADYKQKPNWKECIGLGSFSDCKYFKNKSKCWERFDREAVKERG